MPKENNKKVNIHETDEFKRASRKLYAIVLLETVAACALAVIIYVGLV